MKKDIIVAVLFFCTSSTLVSQETILTNIKTDSLKVLMENSVKKALQEIDTIEVGEFYKLDSKVRVFTKKEAKHKEHELDSLQNLVQKFNYNKKLLSALEKQHKIDTVNVAKIVSELVLKDIEAIDNKLREIINNYKDQKITLKEFQEKSKKLYKQKDSISNTKENLLKKYFGSFNVKSSDVFKTTLNAWSIEEVDIDVYDGLIMDLTVSLRNEVTNKVKKFTNKVSISVLRFRKYGHHKLFEANGGYNFVRVKDVLGYSSKTGNNYFPENAVISIGKNEQKKSLKLKRGLKSILDLRVYTDFLGLIEEESNGIINFEASSTIKISPSPLAMLWTEFLFFKEIKPYFNYSRFDKDDRAISTELIPGSTQHKISNNINLIQNAFIRTGFNLNLMQIKMQKEFPFSISVPLIFEFNMTEVQVGSENLKVNSYLTSIGLNANLRRTKNFGLNLGLYYSQVDNKLNSDLLVQTPEFNLLELNSELYFYNPKDINSAYFLRLNTRRIINSEVNYATIQFGYKKAFSFSK